MQIPPRRRPRIVGAVASASAFVVVAIAVAIVARPLHDDRVVIRFVRRHPSDWLIDLASGYSTVAGPVTIVVLACVGALVLAVRDRAIGRPAAVIGAAWGAVAVSEIVKRVVDRPRPPVGWQLDGPEATPAFPSTHVAGLTALLLVAALVTTAGKSHPNGRSRARAVLVAATACAALGMGAARVYLCMNWASDAVGGLLLGVAAALCAVWSVDQMVLRAPEQTA
ncbi:phosphatase PAP2 family protein [Gordonia sp. HY002]|uniref:phosphatase PAP2 family protein n=1 Tax=Gordonia zhenghanii TaxID=2911516 RepID=UPI001EF0D0E8|nr:phosphatase PAP2 family protein [Gordonia zhenghanii]MCF8569897.1 phosphatase PAP2 family protein [Gordonia zhenghanii]MCF8602419.1 phosphatase PAP2 family protein [Gordonia zhenghanii]